GLVSAWETMTPEEQARVVRLLVSRVDYDGQHGKASITFQPLGLKTLAAELIGRKGDGTGGVVVVSARGAPGPTSCLYGASPSPPRRTGTRSARSGACQTEFWLSGSIILVLVFVPVVVIEVVAIAPVVVIEVFVVILVFVPVVVIEVVAIAPVLAPRNGEGI